MTINIILRVLNGNFNEGFIWVEGKKAIISMGRLISFLSFFMWGVTLPGLSGSLIG
jgi:hypothetical protein